MSRIWMSGLESNSTAANVEWDSLTGTGSISTTTVRSGTYAFRANPTAATGFLTKQFQADTVNDLYFRFYLLITTAPGATVPIFQYTDSSNGVGTSVRLTSGRLLQLFDDNGTGLQIGSSSAALNTGQWYRVEIRNEDKVSGATCHKELLLDGTSVASTTTGQAIDGAGKMRIGVITSGTADLFFDDIAVNVNDAGVAQNGYPGAGSIVHMHPNAAGDNNGWATGAGGTAGATNNFTRVSEVTPDDVTSYNKRTTAGTFIDDYKFQTPASAGIGNNDTISLVAVGGRPGATSATVTDRGGIYRIKSAAAGTVKSSGTIDWSQNAFMSHVDGPPYVYQLYAYTDPTTGLAWTATGTNSLSNVQGGYQNATSSINEIRMSNLWLAVEYVPFVPKSLVGYTKNARNSMIRR